MAASAQCNLASQKRLVLRFLHLCCFISCEVMWNLLYLSAQCDIQGGLYQNDQNKWFYKSQSLYWFPFLQLMCSVVFIPLSHMMGTDYYQKVYLPPPPLQNVQ